MHPLCTPALRLALISSLGAGLLPAQDPDLQSPRSAAAAIPSSDPVPGEASLPTPQVPGGALAGLSRGTTPIHTAVEDGSQPYGVWAAGEGYKASFHDGMTFVPYLGRDYPRNQPLSWRTTSATAGGVDLLGGAPVHGQDALRYEYRFGAVTEAYDVLPEGLEQTFVVHRLPAAGDLVITGAVTTDLVAPDTAPAHQALLFADEQGQVVTSYGAAVAFDAAGRRVALTTGYEQGVVTLRVPGAWLAGAALPVVVDPLLARVFVSGVAEIGAVDIGRDDESVASNVMMAYIRYASAGDGDLFARLMNDDYGSTWQVFVDITASWSTDSASCAFVGGADRWVVALRRYFGNATPISSRVRCHVHDKGDTTLLTTYASLNGPVALNDWRPDVGGVESFFAGDEALVVFQTEDNGGGNFANTADSGVRGVVFDPTAGTNGAFGAPFDICRSANYDFERPSVNKVAAGGASFSWICAMQGFNNAAAGDDWDIFVRRVDNAGTVAAGVWYSDFNYLNTHHQLGPVVEGDGGRYAVTFATAALASTPFKTSLITGEDIQIERFDWAHGAASASSSKPPVRLVGDQNRRWEATGLGYDTNDDSHWVATHRTIAPAGLGAGYYTRVGFNGAATEGFSFLQYTPGEQVTQIACVFDNDADDFLFAFGSDDPNQSLYGRTLQYVQPGPVTVSGQGCSTAAITWQGNQQIGAEFNSVFVDNQVTPVGHFLIVALAPTGLPIQNPAVFPGCQLLVQATGSAYLGTLPFQFGPTASYPIALPEWLGPMTLYFQDWMFDGTLFYATQRLTVPLVR